MTTHRMQPDHSPTVIDQDSDGASPLSRQAYQRLADLIITLRLAPGAPINETAPDG